MEGVPETRRRTAGEKRGQETRTGSQQQSPHAEVPIHLPRHPRERKVEEGEDGHPRKRNWLGERTREKLKKQTSQEEKNICMSFEVMMRGRRILLSPQRPQVLSLVHALSSAEVLMSSQCYRYN